MDSENKHVFCAEQQKNSHQIDVRFRTVSLRSLLVEVWR